MELLVEVATEAAMEDQKAPRSDSRAAALLLLAIGVIAVVTTVLLLDRSQQEGGFLNLLLLAGSAGAAASCLGVLLQENGFATLRAPSGKYGWLISLVPPVAGFAAGAFSLLLALALLTPADSPRNAASAAVFGGIYGLLLGGWSQKLLAAPVLADAAETLESAITTTAGTLFSEATRTRYDGRIAASIRSSEGITFVQGILGVRFIPSATDQDLDDGEHSAQIRVEDGEEGPWANFVITVVSGSALESFPRSRSVKVPTDQVSDKFEFTIVHEPTTEVQGDQVEATSQLGRSILIDVTQAGRTVQLLEIPMDVSRESRPVS